MDLGNLGYAFINTAGVGGAVVLTVYGAAFITYVFLTRWIVRGGRDKRK